MKHGILLFGCPRNRGSLDEINQNMKAARAIRLTIGLQGQVDEVYARVDQLASDLSGLTGLFL